MDEKHQALLEETREKLREFLRTFDRGDVEVMIVVNVPRDDDSSVGTLEITYASHCPSCAAGHLEEAAKLVRQAALGGRTPLAGAVEAIHAASKSEKSSSN